MRRAVVPQVPYVQSVVDGSLDLHDFVRTQLQFYFAVEAYPHSLAQLAGRTRAPGARKALEENVRDERGEGHSAQSHVQTFRALLAKFGVTGAEIDGSPRWPCVVAFNDAVNVACTAAAEESGLATVAAIEDVFTGISRDLGGAIVARGWLLREEVVHYNVHEKLDRAHADALYRELDAASGDEAEIHRGLTTGASLMTALYDELLRAK